jgi:hypothetical protein
VSLALSLRAPLEAEAKETSHLSARRIPQRYYSDMKSIAAKQHKEKHLGGFERPGRGAGMDDGLGSFTSSRRTTLGCERC